MSVVLKSFPFDSMEVLNEESGQMEPDRVYEAEIFRKYFAKFLSTGVYFGDYKNYKENSMKVILDNGLNIKVLKGAGIIEGADYELEEDTIIVLERPITGERIDRIVVRLDKTLAERHTYLDIKQGNGTIPAELQRDDNIYEICIAEVLVKSTSNITESDIVDKRIDKNLCGIVTSLISIDGEELYQRFQEYIDSVTDNLIRKDKDVILDGSFQASSIKDKDNKILSTNDFTDTYKSKLDGIATGATKNTTTATTSANGLMSSTDKAKLDGIAAGANKTTIENNLTSSSTTNGLSAAQGKALKALVDAKQKTISKGTATPSGGSNGDVYIQYF